jgi:cytoskeletal protein CcmA (bactofilin family)
MRTTQRMQASDDKTYTSARSSLGEELMITGKYRSKGNLHLRGQLQGAVHCHKLLVGEAAQIEGHVVAEEVVTQGRVVGAGPPAWCPAQSYVEGELSCHTLTIEQGATFEGESRADKPSRLNAGT